MVPGTTHFMQEDLMWRPNAGLVENHSDDAGDHPDHPYRSILREKFDPIRDCDCHVCRIVDFSRLEDWGKTVDRSVRRMKIWVILVAGIVALIGAAVDLVQYFL